MSAVTARMTASADKTVSALAFSLPSARQRSTMAVSAYGTTWCALPSATLVHTRFKTPPSNTHSTADHRTLRPDSDLDSSGHCEKPDSRDAHRHPSRHAEQRDHGLGPQLPSLRERVGALAERTLRLPLE